jgi:hypothetical protein
MSVSTNYSRCAPRVVPVVVRTKRCQSQLTTPGVRREIAAEGVSLV